MASEFNKNKSDGAKLWARRVKFEKAYRVRSIWTDADFAAEESRLIEEAEEICAARGFSTDRIGERWGKNEEVELQTNGQLGPFLAASRHHEEQQNADA